jgi:hypothetical protein
MNEWDLEELNELCKREGISDPLIYTWSLQFRVGQAEYHAQEAYRVWDELFRKTFVVGGPDEQRALLACEAHVEASVYALHSLADILAQVINVVILGGQNPEGKVSLKRLIGDLDKHGAADQVAKETNRLLGSEAFGYIDAFCNTIKHRRLVKPVRFQVEYGHDGSREFALQFEAFTYSGKSYPDTWGKDILDRYRLELFELCNNVGVAINDFLR